MLKAQSEGSRVAAYLESADSSPSAGRSKSDSSTKVRLVAFSILSENAVPSSTVVTPKPSAGSDGHTAVNFTIPSAPWQTLPSHARKRGKCGRVPNVP